MCSRPGDLLESFATHGEGGVDATALFGLRVGAAPRAVLAFEPHLQALAPVGGHDAVDVFVAAHLQTGMTLATVPLAELAPPLAREWLLDTRGGTVSLQHPQLGVSYAQPVTEQVRQCLNVARGEGRCLVLTGSGLDLREDAPLPQDFPVARRLGRLVAAAVRVR